MCGVATVRCALSGQARVCLVVCVIADLVNNALSRCAAQAPGGHNVIAGIFDYIKRVSPDNELVGFLMGPHGVYTGAYNIIDAATMDKYRNMGVRHLPLPLSLPAALSVREVLHVDDDLKVAAQNAGSRRVVFCHILVCCRLGQRLVRR